jgi:hypothetical protein
MYKLVFQLKIEPTAVTGILKDQFVRLKMAN